MRWHKNFKRHLKVIFKSHPKVIFFKIHQSHWNQTNKKLKVIAVIYPRTIFRSLIYLIKLITYICTVPICSISLENLELENGKKNGQNIFYASAKGCSIWFNNFIDMRTTVNLSISCRKNVFLLKFSMFSCL